MPPHEINFIEKRNDHLWIVYTYEAKLVIRLLSLATATILNNIYTAIWYRTKRFFDVAGFVNGELLRYIGLYIQGRVWDSK